jgi:hypothetical protein
MISNDAIHVQFKKEGKYDIVKNIDTSNADDYMCAMCDV